MQNRKYIKRASKAQRIETAKAALRFNPQDTDAAKLLKQLKGN